MNQHCLALEGMKFYANHGYYPSETEKGGEYIVDIYMYLDLEKAGITDDLNETVNYESIYSIVEEIMKTPQKLIESVAYKIKSKIIETHPELKSFTVKVRKISPPLSGQVNESYVEFRHTKNITAHIENNKSSNSNYWEERGKY